MTTERAVLRVMWEEFKIDNGLGGGAFGDAFKGAVKVGRCVKGGRASATM